MKNELLEKYISVKEAIAKLQEEEKMLKTSIVDDMKQNSLNTFTNDLGKFTVASRTNYTYSDKVKSMEEKVKIAKHKEVEKGIAKESITEYLVYTASKEE